VNEPQESKKRTQEQQREYDDQLAAPIAKQEQHHDHNKQGKEQAESQ